MGRAAALARLPWDHTCTALRGLCRPRREAGRLVVQAVVRSERGVLLALRRELRGWELPGGHPHAGEEERVALAREVREETGLEIALDGLAGEYRRSGFYAHRARVYRAHVVGGALAASVEAPVVRWFASEALPRELFPWFRVPIEDALRGGEPVLREERLGLAAVAAGFAIDLRMRMRGAGAPSGESQ